MPNPKAEECKSTGNSFFSQKKFTEALKHYSAAISIDPSNHIYYSNRAACYSGLGDHKAALEEANLCIKKNPSWGKGYWRKASALLSLERAEEAVEACRIGLARDPSNDDLKNKLQEAEAAVPKKQPNRPAAQPAKDRSKMSPAESIKEDGNDYFKDGQFLKAIGKYQQALDHPTAKGNQELTVSCYNNQAACHQQLQNYSTVITLCNQVIELDPNNLKAYTRRGLAKEHLEKYKSALDDFLYVIQRDSSATQAQQGANRVRQLIQKYY